MKVSLLIYILCFVVLFTTCKKTDNSTIPYGTSKNYSSVLSSTPPSNGGTFSFTKIIIAPNPVKIGVASKVTAVATGNNLKYTWTTSHGDLFGTGSTIYYSDSCIGEYSITCVVTDGTHNATLTVPITISN